MIKTTLSILVFTLSAPTKIILITVIFLFLQRMYSFVNFSALHLIANTRRGPLYKNNYLLMHYDYPTFQNRPIRRPLSSVAKILALLIPIANY